MQNNTCCSLARAPVRGPSLCVCLSHSLLRVIINLVALIVSFASSSKFHSILLTTTSCLLLILVVVVVVVVVFFSSASSSVLFGLFLLLLGMISLRLALRMIILHRRRLLLQGFGVGRTLPCQHLSITLPSSHLTLVIWTQLRHTHRIPIVEPRKNLQCATNIKVG